MRVLFCCTNGSEEPGFDFCDVGVSVGACHWFLTLQLFEEFNRVVSRKINTEHVYRCNITLTQGDL